MGDSSNNYDDIINLPHHTSKKRPRLSNHDRAAQFSPFAALQGHGAAIAETQRTTERRISLSEDEKSEISEKLRILSENEEYGISARIVFFIPDKLKSGGSYGEITSEIKRIDSDEGCIVTCEGTRIPIEDIASIELQNFTMTSDI